jgi:hypothetical protein
LPSGLYVQNFLLIVSSTFGSSLATIKPAKVCSRESCSHSNRACNVQGRGAPDVIGRLQFYRSIFANDQIGISFFDIDRSTVFSDRALHEMLGYTGEEHTRFTKRGRSERNNDRDVFGLRSVDSVEESQCSCTTCWTWSAIRWSGPSLSAGKHIIVFDFKYDGTGLGKGGTGGLTVDAKEADRKTIPHTIPFLMAIDETFDIGVDTRTAVDFSYDLPFRFNGTIDKLTYNLGHEQMSPEDQKTAAKAIATAHD